MLEQITGDFLSGQDIGGRNYDVGLKEGAIALAPNRGNIDDAVYAQALRLSDAIVDGTLPVAANAEAFDALPY